ncbi:gluconokinase [Gleimia hominis]|uniref:Gluconokinase n=1 Tax=Gleimia hominis TaxID=595468 RepID=A0ABU3I8I3_9ACTO|nr:gluconokinase [Gleimia hominis]MDT3766693.1 gluconokinase [Gleimia hominis]
MSIHVVVMGVAGSGKSTVAEAIHDQLGYTLAEGDEFHPQANIDKMSAGVPLNDEDRWPWLRSINTWMKDKAEAGESTVVSSSALKRAYRDVLRDDVPVFFIHLEGTEEVLAQRMKERPHHFMPASLLRSQFETLQPLEADEGGVVVNVDGSKESEIQQAIAAIEKFQAAH